MTQKIPPETIAAGGTYYWVMIDRIPMSAAIEPRRLGTKRRDPDSRSARHRDRGPRLASTGQ